MTATAKIIQDSVNVHGNRLTTLQLKYQRFVHAEFMTHRVFSRNASSSRAIPVAKMIEQVRNDPATPVHWGANQPGMQAKAELIEDHLYEAKEAWALAAVQAADTAERMNKCGLHKQVANRILEPFQWIHVVVSATEYDNFFELRDHDDADPNIRALAVQMRMAMNGSKPQLLRAGEWHLPYVTDAEQDENRWGGSHYVDLRKVSSARSARVSYLTHDGAAPVIFKDLTLFDQLAGGNPIHASPLEHQGTPGDTNTGNFKGFTQFRKLWEKQL